MPFTIPDGENIDQQNEFDDLKNQYSMDSSMSDPMPFGQWLSQRQSMAKGGNVKSPLLPSFEKGLESVPREKGTAAEFFRDTAARPGVKTQEIEDRNLQSAYSDNTQKITKQQAHEIAAGNPLQPLTVRTLPEDPDRERHAFGDEDDMGEPAAGYARYKNYGLQFPDGKNYREKLYIDPTVNRDTAAGHWSGEGGVIAHARVQDRETPEGKRAMHVEEIQADVHQKGHKTGYRDKNATIYPVVEQRLNNLADKAVNTMTSHLGHDVAKSQVQMIIDQARAYDTPNNEARAMEAYRKAIRDLGLMAYPHDHMYAPKDKAKERINAELWRHELRDHDFHMREAWGNKAPDMPFKSNWHEVVLKHLLHDAAKEGHDVLYITPGKDQAERAGKDLQDVSRFEYEYSPSYKQYVVRAYDKNNSLVDENPELDIKNIAKKFGNKVADRVASGEGTELRNGAKYFDLESPVTIGGEFHRNLYDKKIPNFLNSIGKKHGTQVRSEMSLVPPTGKQAMEIQDKIPEPAALNPRISTINTPEGAMPVVEAINKYFTNPFEKAAWKNALAMKSGWAPDYNEVVESRLIPEMRQAMNLKEKDWSKFSAVTPEYSSEDKKLHDLHTHLDKYRHGWITWSDLKDYLSKNSPEILDKLYDKRPVHRFDITPSLRKQILEEGLPMYKKGGDVQSSSLIPSEFLNRSHKDVTKRIPELTEAANKIRSGELSATEYQALVDKHKPVYPYHQVPDLATHEQMFKALKPEQREKIGRIADYPEGHEVRLRLDIPAYSQHGVWVPTIHDKNNKVIAHQAASHIKNASFSAPEKAGIAIASGAEKGPYATVKGLLQKTSEQDIHKLAKKYLKHPDWRQVGMDPTRHGYFYDRHTQEPVEHAKEVMQVGPLVLAKNPVYGDKSKYKYDKGGKVDSESTVKAANTKDIRDRSLWENIKDFKNLWRGSEKTALDLFDPKGEHNGAADAMRHVLHSAKMTEAYGKPVAWALDKAHEYLYDTALGQSIPERHMDLYNGALGRQIGSQNLSDADMVERARQMVQSGQARTLSANQSRADYKKGGNVSVQKPQGLLSDLGFVTDDGQE